MKKKLLSVVLALAMVLSLMPAAFAAEGDTTPAAATALPQADENGVITLTENTDISATGWVVEGKVTLDLAGRELKAANTAGGNIDVPAGASLTLKDSVGTGKIYTETDYTGGATGYAVIDVTGGSFTMESGFVQTVREDPANKGQFALGIGKGGTMTINGGKVEAGWYAISGNGTDTAKTSTVVINGGELVSTADYALYLPHNGNTTVKGGTVYGASGGVSIQRGTLNISDNAVVTSKGTGDTGNWGDGTGGQAAAAVNIAAEYGDCTVNISGGKLTAEKNALIIKADSTHKISFAITGGKFSSDVSGYLTGDYVQNANGEVGKLEQVAVAEVAAADGSKTTKYASLTGAVNAAKDGETVTLLKDVDLGSGYVNIAKKLTLDLNGYTVTGSNTWVIGVYSDVTINDSSNGQGKIINSSTSSGTRIAVLAQEKSQDEKTCKLTIEGGTITATGIENSYGVFSNNSTTTYGPTIIVNGGEITGYFAGLTVTHDTDLTISGGEITGNYYAVSGNGSADDTDISINGGKLVSKDGNAIYHPQVGNMTIGGNAELTGPNGVQYCGAGTLTIQDNVVITATGPYTEFPAKPSEQGDGSTDDGAALSIVSRGGGYQDGGQTMTVNITGGTLNSVNNAAISVYRLQNKNGWVTNNQTDLSSYLAALNITGGKLSGGERKGTLEIDTAAEKQVAVTGGLFSSDPSAYCVASMTGVTNTDNATKADYPYAVGEKVADAKPAVVESATVPANTPENASDDVKSVAKEMTGGAGVKQDAALEGAIKNAANGNKIEGNTELATGKTVTATLNEATSGSVTDNEVAIVYQTYVDVTVTDAKKNDSGKVTSFTAALTPMYRVVATTQTVVNSNDEIKVSGEVEADANAVLVKSGEELNGLADRQYEVKLALPDGFAVKGERLCIKHEKNGSVEYYTGTVSDDGKFVTFTTNGFSPFTVYAASESAASIGDNVYPTLQAAVDAVQDGQTIGILKADQTATVNRTVKFTVEPAGKNYTISLGGNCTDKDTTEHVFDVVYTAPSGGSSSSYTVNVEDSKNGTVTASHKSASKNTTVTLTVKADKGYELDELTVTDKNGKELKLTDKGNGKYTFAMPASKVDVKATFAEIVEKPAYSDVSASAWYAKAVAYVTEKGMMEGDSGKFMPLDKLTRSQMAQVLFNLEGKKSVNYALTFGDMNGTEWYAEAVRWAASEQIVNGYDNGNFGPNDPITREQLVTVLYRYAQYKGLDTATTEENLTSFADAAQVSGYAVSAMNWAVGAGVINGTDSGLAPKATATRAEVAQILMNFDQKF